MTGSKLGKVLEIFESAREPLAMQQAARSLGISEIQLEGMLEYWVRKGRLKRVDSQAGCGTCAANGDCAFVLKLPRSYEPAGNPDQIPLQKVRVGCYQEYPVEDQG